MAYRPAGREASPWKRARDGRASGALSQNGWVMRPIPRLSAYEVAVNGGQLLRQFLDTANNGVAAATEQKRKVVLGLAIDGDTEHGEPRSARLLI